MTHPRRGLISIELDDELLRDLYRIAHRRNVALDVVIAALIAAAAADRKRAAQASADR